MPFGLQLRKVREYGALKRNKYVCVEHASVKRQRHMKFRIIFKKCEPRLYTIYVRPLVIEVEGVFVAVASLDGRGVGSGMFAMASILSCLLPYWVLVNDV